VICTARDAAATIDRALGSVLAQTLADLELIVVDDGSNDATPARVGALVTADRRVRLIRTAGVGRGRALNLALAEVRHELVANIDADDEWHPEHLARTAGALRLRPAFAILGTACLQLQGAARAAWPDLPHAADVVEVTRLLTQGNPIFHSSVVMRRDVVRMVGGYREELASNFDYDLWVRLAGAGHRLGRLPLILAVKRIHPNQAFLYGRRLRYLSTSAGIQARAIRALGGGRQDMARIPLRFLWGLLPVGLRLRLRPRRL
jgi:glycosyltransferase involved in cell wall biosynthesis